MSEIFRDSQDGFELVGLRNEGVELAVVPTLGGKIISLIDRRTGREWMWHPGGDLKLFANKTGDAFERSTMSGADECLPSVAACEIPSPQFDAAHRRLKRQGRMIPDHGEVWTARSEELEGLEVEKGEIGIRCSLPISPLEFVRWIRMENNFVELRYELRNRSPRPEYYLWAFHPLMRIEEGDELVLPGEGGKDLSVESTSRGDRRGEKWAWPRGRGGVDLSRLDLGETPGYVKGFWPRRASQVGIENRRRGERILFEFDSPHISAMGFWLSRGGWNGYHHVAIEPTNAPADSLATAIAENLVTPIPAGETVAWSFRIIVGS